jgi:uncharacterized protein YjbI with pentapeptide repeats
MADETQLQLIRSSVQKWNVWRRENDQIPTDLHGADLSGAYLRGAYLNGAHLRRANLSRADLSRADLSGADLNGAHLSRANLRGADLSRADLNGAYLSGAHLSHANLDDAHLSDADLGHAYLNAAHLSRANLSRANLIRADLSHADLSYANLSDGMLYETVFADVNLSTVMGLESCNHLGPSALDHRTLVNSGPLPLAFLRGSGLPDALIEYLHSLLRTPIQFYSCFISYSTKDQEFADRIYADLQDKGVRCWFAPENLKIGDPFRQRIDMAIRRHEKLLLILSEHSVKSDWVREEVEAALERESREKRLVLFPVRVDNAVMDTDQAWAASIRRQRHIGDFRDWKNHDSYGKAFQRLQRDLKAENSSAGTKHDS